MQIYFAFCGDMFIFKVTDCDLGKSSLDITICDIKSVMLSFIAFPNISGLSLFHRAI